MFSGIGQWISSFQQRMISDKNIPHVNFEDVQMIIRNRRDVMVPQAILREGEHSNSSNWDPLFITTIPITFMNMHGKKGDIPLIEGTLPPEQEEAYINELIDNLDTVALGDLLIIIYGQNAMDKTAMEKARQLSALGFLSVCVYSGGMFEWCLLQDVYGNKEFPITFTGGRFVEPLIFKGKRLFSENN
jgi:hypothetical protein